jgi:GT2 family glycosyltransferase
VKEIVNRFVLEYHNAVIVESDVPNLAAALQLGSVKASGESILYMDSDCRFVPGTIHRFKIAIEQHMVVKGGIVFEANSWISRVIAKSREHHTAERVTAYKPPLAIKAELKDHIGGYFFDSRLIWREDSDLDYRIRKAGIPIHFEPDAAILHPPLTLKHDLTSAYRYGVGLARARWYHIPLTEVPRSVASTFQSKGYVPALYMCFRNRVYDLGIAREHFRLKRGKG